MGFEVLEGGVQTTVQELPGRVGYLDLGIYPGGPMDHLGFRAANLLVGNPPEAAALEVTAGGFKARFDADALVAVTGADMGATLNGAALPPWESVAVGAGDVLALQQAMHGGFRAYVAVQGAIDVPEYLGSRATFTVGGFGGFAGRGLKKKDVVAFGVPPARRAAGGRRFDPARRPAYGETWEIEAMRGPQADPDYLTAADMTFFFAHSWKVDRNSNRMGIRLEPHEWAWARSSGGVAGGHPSNILDNGYPVWAVNVCGNQPIILAADGPSLGGFICAATLVQAATWKVGQLVPGRDAVRFREVTFDDAVRLADTLERELSTAVLEPGQSS
jgi:urea carboxylase